LIIHNNYYNITSVIQLHSYFLRKGSL